MSPNIPITTIRLVILVISFELMSAPFISSGKTGTYPVAIQQEHQHPSLLFLNFLLEKTKERAKGKEEGHKYSRLELADFSAIICCLTQIHTPLTAYLPETLFFDSEPPLFKRFHTFLI